MEREREAALRLLEAVEAEKCHACGCMHAVVLMLEDDLAGAGNPPGRELGRALEAGRAVLKPVETDCRGCEPCLPPLALKAARGMEG